MEAQGFGTILNVASSAGLPGGPYMAGYRPKAYVVSLTRGVAEELEQPGLCLCSSLPGLWTPSSTTAVPILVFAPSRASPRSSAAEEYADAPPQDHHRAQHPDAPCHHGPEARSHALLMPILAHQQKKSWADGRLTAHRRSCILEVSENGRNVPENCTHQRKQPGRQERHH